MSTLHQWDERLRVLLPKDEELNQSISLTHCILRGDWNPDRIERLQISRPMVLQGQRKHGCLKAEGLFRAAAVGAQLWHSICKRNHQSLIHFC